MIVLDTLATPPTLQTKSAYLDRPMPAMNCHTLCSPFNIVDRQPISTLIRMCVVVEVDCLLQCPPPHASGLSWEPPGKTKATGPVESTQTLCWTNSTTQGCAPAETQGIACR